MQVELLSNSSLYRLQKAINDFLEELTRNESVVLDIKLNSTTNMNSVMIIYCDKSEVRDIKINNILSE